MGDETFALQIAQSLDDPAKMMITIIRSGKDVRKVFAAAGLASVTVWVCFHTDTINTVASGSLELLKGLTPGEITNLIGLAAGGA